MKNSIIGKIVSFLKDNYIVFIILILLFWTVSISYSIYSNNIENKNIEEAKTFEQLIKNDDFESCKNYYFLKNTISKNNNYLNYKLLSDFETKCDKKYNIKNLVINKDNCLDLISSNTYKDLSDKYLIFDAYQSVKNQCTSKFLEAKISTWSFFQARNDFKSSFNIDFNIEFFKDLENQESEEFIENRKKAKIRLADLLSISPNVNVNPDDIYISPNRATVNLNLLSLTNYKISLKNISKTNILDLKTPENKYLWIHVINPVSLYSKNFLPKFEIVDYDSKKKKTSIKICNISKEDYFKIEILKWFLSENNNNKEVSDFFINKLDNIKSDNCKKIDIILRENNSNQLFVKKSFNFDDFFTKDQLKNSMYYVSFDNYLDRNFNNKVQEPLLFWFVNSHITMKISRNQEAFFFVNDLSWNPLPDQEISIDINEFSTKEYNYETDSYKIKSPLDYNVLTWNSILWKTDKNWILKVDLSKKIDDAFYKTLLNSWNYSFDRKDNSFFISSSSNNYLSYNHSKWNAWIAPWNFWYKIQSDYYYDNNEKAWDDIYLDKRAEVQEAFYSYVYTDRILYLPWETVFFKSIIRKSKDLSIVKDKIFNVIINDSNWKEIYKKSHKLNEFGSIYDSLKLTKESPIWYYSLYIKDGDKDIQSYSFSVEVFQNPKFKVDLWVETIGLESQYVNIKNTKKDWYTNYNLWEFYIKTKINSKYYNWASLSWASFAYKIYKQRYYWENFWDDCYYWCYWESEKELYTSWEWKLDSNGDALLNNKIEFESNYDDYKYIIEVSVTDNIWDIISWSNSIIAKLDSKYKRWNSNFSLDLHSKNKFYKSWDEVHISWKLDWWVWTNYFDNKYFLTIKKKDYKNKIVKDVRGYDRPITKQEEKLVEIMPINSSNFEISNNWELNLKYKLKEEWEYIFEYWALSSFYANLSYKDLKSILDNFNKNKTFEVNDKDKKLVISYNDLLLQNSKKYFSVLLYWNKDASNPLISDNKIQVLSEKISYNIWDKARVLIRLPFSKWKILWTIEKSWVIESEYIDVKSNMFFKEFIVDDKFIPNAYIWVVAISSNPWLEYKVWYTEVVVDKTNKKSFIDIKTNKKTYLPREKVNIDLNVKDKFWKPVQSEISLMIVDDSLISLMWNINLWILESFYKKLPFQIQTSLTSIAMFKNFYFAIPWIVWWSWESNFKWWDSNVSSRNIFKNTAYYNPKIISDKNWKASISFELPDNLTNFRIIAISNSNNNYFWVAEQNIEVRKEVFLEAKVPLIIRNNDEMFLSANIFNNTNKDQDFKISLETDWLIQTEKLKNIKVLTWQNSIATFKVKNKNEKDIIKFKFSLVWKWYNDIVEGEIKSVNHPTFINFITKNTSILKSETWYIWFNIWSNVNREKSSLNIVFSNNLLAWIENIAKSLMIYPYWCIEQTTSSTFPNAILFKFTDIFKDLDFDKNAINKNIKYWLERIYSMQNTDWGFVYWQWNTDSDLHISPYVLRTLIDMKDLWIDVNKEVIDKAVWYLIKSYNSEEDENIKYEIFWTLAKAWFWKKAFSDFWINNSLNTIKWRHASLALAYALFYTDKNTYKNNINYEIKNIISNIINDTDNYRYWDHLSDKAILASLLIDYNPKDENIEKLIKELYDIDWNSYYYSTQSKNNAFLSFAKYINITNSSNISKYVFNIWNSKNNKYYFLGDSSPIIRKHDYNLKDLVSNISSKIDIKLANLEWKKIYVNAILKEYPLDMEKIPSSSNWVKVTRDIYEILDDSKLYKCEEDLNDYYNRWKDLSKISSCNWVYKKKTDNIFKKSSKYKILDTIIFDTEKNRKNIVLEDYIPSSFRVLNSKFKTNSIVKKDNENYYWNHIEILDDRLFANISNWYGDKYEYSYYIIPEYVGLFTYPPVSAYIMYEPEIRANTKFEKIEVR